MELKDMMMLYGVTLGSRKTQRKKNLFIESVLDVCKQNNVKAEVKQTKEKAFKTTSIVMGDLNSAKYVFVTGFDTSVQYFTPLKYFPFHPEKSSFEENKKNGIRFLFVVLFAIGIYFPLKAIMLQAGTILNWIELTVLLLGIILVLFPKANTYNFSKSSSIAVMMKLVEDCSKCNDVAYVLCDHTASGYIGFKAIKNLLPENTKVILLGPLASGNKTVVAYKEKNNQFGEQFSSKFSIPVIQRKYTQEQSKRNCLSLFDNCIYMACGDIENKEFVVNNTACSKDVAINMDRLENIVEGLKKGLI